MALDFREDSGHSMSKDTVKWLEFKHKITPTVLISNELFIIGASNHKFQSVLTLLDCALFDYLLTLACVVVFLCFELV